MWARTETLLLCGRLKAYARARARPNPHSAYTPLHFVYAISYTMFNILYGGWLYPPRDERFQVLAIGLNYCG